MKRFITLLAVGLLATGCINVQKTTYPEYRAKLQTSSALPVDLINRLERDIRKHVESLHRSGYGGALTAGEIGDDYRINVAYLNRQERQRDKYTGDYFDCTQAKVDIFLNYSNVRYDSTGSQAHKKGVQYQQNKQHLSRTDRICIYQKSGELQYLAGRMTPVKRP